MEPVGFSVAGRDVQAGDVELAWEVEPVGSGHRIDLVVRNPGRETVNLDRVTMHVDARPELVLEHGYQSWSVVRRARPSDVVPERLQAPDWARGCWLADPASGGMVVGGDQFLVTTEGVVGWLDARSHLGTVTAPAAGGLEAAALLDGVPLGPGEERRLDPLWLASGDPGAAYSEYAVLWAQVAGGRGGGPSPLVWCSWYQYFGDVTPADVRANLPVAAGAGIEVVQVDDGWQAAIGDWLEPGPRWSEVGSMAAVAAEIADAGCRPGLWTAPFVASEGSRLAAEHDDWFARHPPSGKPAKAMYNPAWGGWALALDTTNPAVLDHLRSVYAELRSQGFGYHKIDFCYAAALPADRHDRGATRAEALRAGLEAVRDGIGDDAFLLGCGCPFGPAVGVVDAMRVSPDVAPFWEPRPTWPGFDMAEPAAANAIRASVLRSPLHRRLWLDDPDCALLRTFDTELDDGQRERLSAAIARSGGFLALSDDLTRYGEREWRALGELRAACAAGDAPVELADPFAPDLVP